MRNIDIVTRDDFTSGFLSYVITTIDTMYHSIINGRIPVVDLRFCHSPGIQFQGVRGKINPWDVYFKQPFCIGLNDINEGCDDIQIVNFSRFYTLEKSRVEKNMIGKTCISFNDDIERDVDEYFKKHINNNKVLGVRVRGTDYNQCKLSGHHIQPSIEMVMEDIDNIISKYDIDKLFISTESSEYMQKFIQRYGDMILTIQDDYFENKSGQVNCVYLKTTYEKFVQSNKKYLEAIMIISKLKYTILSHTNSLELYKFLNIGNNIYEKIYELGKY